MKIAPGSCYLDRMIDPILPLQKRVGDALSASFPEVEKGLDLAVHRSEHADYQCDLAMALARKVRKAPKAVAQALVEKLAPDEALASAVISGPGFINLTLRAEYLAAELQRMEADARLGSSQAAAPQKVVIDYSSPNLAKEMHVGHLRSTLIGDALTRVLEFQGHTVIRQNHIGDWGTPFGMLLEYMRDQGIDGQSSGLRELSKFYKAARQKFDGDPEFANRARLRVVKLQALEPETLALWKALIGVTLEHIDILYQRLGVTLKPSHVAGESQYNPELAGICAELEASGVARISDGALCAFPPGFTNREGEQLPLILRKQDGGFTYGTTDLAALKYRVRTLGATRVVYVVGAPQATHLAMVYAIGRMAGWVPDNVRLEHVAFGSVLGEDKKILKSRAGEALSLGSLLDEAVERARKLIDEKSTDVPEETRAALANSVGIGAIKYADLGNDHARDYIFDLNRMVAFEGNTGPYLMYAHARIHSILRKAAEEGIADGAIAIAEPQERALALELLQFPQTVDRVGETLQAHRLAQHLYAVATAYSAFYRDCPVLKSEGAVRASRLSLCKLTARVLELGLRLLSLDAPERM
jgi:arginyl-tRNA synthetase